MPAGKPLVCNKRQLCQTLLQLQLVHEAHHLQTLQKVVQNNQILQNGAAGASSEEALHASIVGEPPSLHKLP